VKKKKYFFFRVVKDAFYLLDKKEMVSCSMYTFSLLVLSLLDIFGIMIISLVGSLSFFNTANFNESFIGGLIPENELNFIPFLIANQLLILVFAFSLLIIKSIVNILLIWRILHFFSRKQVDFANQMIRNLFSNNFATQRNLGNQKTIFAMNDSINSIFTGVLFPFINILSDVFLVFILFVFLFLTSIQLTLLNGIVFISIFLLVKKISFSIYVNGQVYTHSSIESRHLISESFEGYREISVFNIKQIMISKFIDSKLKNAFSFMRISFMQLLPKYIFEVILVFISLGIIFLGYFSVHRNTLLSFILIFLASAYRIFPALLRLQANFLQLKSQQPSASLGINYFHNSLGKRLKIFSEETRETLIESPSIQVRSLTFKHDDMNTELFRDFNVLFPSNSFSVLIGLSGSGKSSLIDILLGFIPPESYQGKIVVNGEVQSLLKFENVAFVPQKPFIFGGSVIENITFHDDLSSIDFDLLERSLITAGLEDLVYSLPQGLQTLIMNSENRLSGGELQRLCLARALYCQPRVLILDESLNALDVDSERKILFNLKKLSESCTTILVSHGQLPLEFADNVVKL